MKSLARSFGSRGLIQFGICVLLFLAATPEARADLIEIAPPGPGGPDTWGHAMFFDEAAHGTFNLPNGPQYFNGWVSRYGLINGGQYCFTNLFDFASTDMALVSWDYAGSDYWMRYLTVWGTGPDDQFLQKTFEVRFAESKISSPQEISLPDGFEIHSIAFYGTNRVPEPSSIVLLLFGLAAVVGLKGRWIPRSRKS